MGINAHDFNNPAHLSDESNPRLTGGDFLFMKNSEWVKTQEHFFRIIEPWKEKSTVTSILVVPQATPFQTKTWKKSEKQSDA